MNMTICGAGNAAQTLIALLGEAHRVTVFAPLADEADRLRAASSTQGVTAIFQDGSTRSGRPCLITRDPHAAAQGAELILLAMPAFAHEQVLAALAPHLEPGSWIGALPARGGFDWMARRGVPLPPEVTLFGLQTLPWACRIRGWGRQVEVLGTKSEVDIAVWPSTREDEVMVQMQALFGVSLRRVPSFLALTLANTGQVIHPGILYGLLRDWDGTPFAPADTPLFYGGVDDFTAGVLEALSDEVQGICRALERWDASLDLHSVEPLHTWLRRAYGGQIGDPSTLRSAFNSNRAYAGLRVPVQCLEDGRCVPDFTSRYLSEDIPFGLLVSKGIGELAGAVTPTIDGVIEWAQAQLGCRYLVNGRVCGPSVAHSHAPQRFGLQLADLIHG